MSSLSLFYPEEVNCVARISSIKIWDYILVQILQQDRQILVSDNFICARHCILYYILFFEFRH